MSLDPVMLQLLQASPTELTLPLDWVAIRAAHKAMEPILAGPAGPTPVKSVEHHRIDGPAGFPALRVYQPEGVPTMTVIHFHGGGWTIGDLDTTDRAVRTICNRLNAIVVSCSYRLAPEHPFPAAFDDALLAAKWALAHVSELGGDPDRVVLAGDSAGGNLAAAVAIALRDEARVALPDRPLPRPLAQLLLYPGVDVRASSHTTDSYLADRDPSLPSKMVDLCIEAYVRGNEHGDWRVSPLAAEDLSELPPAMIVVLTVDPLHDQGVAYVAGLREAGVVVEMIEFPNLTHGFCHFGNLVPAAGAAFDDVLARFAQFVALARFTQYVALTSGAK